MTPNAGVLGPQAPCNSCQGGQRVWQSAGGVPGLKEALGAAGATQLQRTCKKSQNRCLVRHRHHNDDAMARSVRVLPTV